MKSSQHKMTPLIIGNWKMNPTRVSEAVSIAKAISQGTRKYSHISVIVAPPAPFQLLLQKSAPQLVRYAQTMHDQPLGAFTGEVSPVMLQELGIKGVIIGHSERRALGETDALIQKKVVSALKHKLAPVICIGERERDQNGDFFSFVKNQITEIFSVVPASQYKNIVIAYEPIWAIGTGKTATPDDVIEMRLFIQKVLIDTIGRPGAGKIRVLYGGSVTDTNARDLFATNHIDGFLVGGASIRPAEFISIVKIVDQLRNTI